MQQITVRMPDEYGNKLNKLSKQIGMRRSDIIRLAMKQFLEETDETNRRPPYSKISHLLGIVESDVEDLGQSHRKYLIQKVRKGSR
jgi:metal-responsive CopG/Arc/MetJ family transcriptional regulator